MSSKNLQTEKQRAKSAKHRNIYDVFCEVREQNPDDTFTACLREVASRFNCTISGVLYAINAIEKNEQ